MNKLPIEERIKALIPAVEKTDTVVLTKKKNGGARPGSGRPKGAITVIKKTDAVKAAQEEMVNRIINVMHPILDAQINAAKGKSYLYRIDEERDSKGKLISRKHVIVEDADEIREFLDEHEGGAGVMEDNYYYITTKDPDTRAIDSLLDRAFGKAIQKGDPETPPFQLNINLGPIMKKVYGTTATDNSGD